MDYVLTNKPTVSTAVIATTGAWLIYVITQAVYRLWFSPIAGFPGPRLAAVSFWYDNHTHMFRRCVKLTSFRYEIYYDVYLGGQYTFEIGRMHEKYGSIVRINPYELHVYSPEFIEKLYTGPLKRRHKWDWYTAQFGLQHSMFGTNDHDLHRIRRAAVNPFFSKGAARKLQPIIDERINALLTRFREFQTSSTPMPLTYAFSAYTNGLSLHYISREVLTRFRHCSRICLCSIRSSS